MEFLFSRTLSSPLSHLHYGLQLSLGMPPLGPGPLSQLCSVPGACVPPVAGTGCGRRLSHLQWSLSRPWGCRCFQCADFHRTDFAGGMGKREGGLGMGRGVLRQMSLRASMPAARSNITSSSSSATTLPQRVTSTRRVRAKLASSALKIPDFGGLCLPGVLSSPIASTEHSIREPQQAWDAWYLTGHSGLRVTTSTSVFLHKRGPHGDVSRGLTSV